MSCLGSLRGKSPRALEVASTPATRHTPVKVMNPPASLMRRRSFSFKERGGGRKRERIVSLVVLDHQCKLCNLSEAGTKAYVGVK